MSFRSSLGEIQGAVAHSIDLNEDCSYFAVATDDGVKIHETESCELQSESETGPVGGATMLGKSQIVGLTKGGLRTSRILANALVLHDVGNSNQSPTTITVSAEPSKGGPVIRSCMTQNHLAIICERSVRIYRYNFAHEGRECEITKIATYETALNPLGLCCLRAKRCVFPGRSKGQIILVDLASALDDNPPHNSKKASDTSRNNKAPSVNIIPAHNAALRAINLTSDGTIVASASETGTIIRLHHTPTQARLAEFRRGVQTATIHSLAFSPSSSHLAVTSDTNTLHVFAVSGKNHNLRYSTERTASLSPSHSPSKFDNLSENTTSQSSWPKWPTLSKIPFAPRVFSDVYSIATCPFDPGAKGMEGSQTPKGLVGWTDDETLVVLSAGRDARYERFAFEVGGTTEVTPDLPETSIGEVHQIGRGGFADARVDSTESVPAKVWRIGWMRFMRPN